MYRPDHQSVVHEPCGARKITACYAQGACVRARAQAGAAQPAMQGVRHFSAVHSHPLAGLAIPHRCMP